MLTCTICKRAQFEGDRMQAAEAGWVCTLARDICPKCCVRLRKERR
jgi:hypothetical protein